MNDALITKQLLALARLASNGAKALAISAGLDAQQFHRVFSDRAQMPEDMESALCKALAYSQSGFQDCAVQASNCRQVEDIARLSELGFTWKPLSFIASEREVAGGNPLQRYCVSSIEIQGTLRVWVLRMASIKFSELFGKYEAGDIPTIVVPTKEIGFLNEVMLKYSTPQETEGLRNALEQASSKNVKPLIELVQAWIATAVAGNQMLETRQRVTAVARLADEQSRLQDWDEPTRKLAQSHEVYPISVKFRSVDGVGMLADGTPVFIDVVTIKKGQRKTISPNVLKHCQHVIAFHRSGTDTDPKFDLIFDGPMGLVVKASKARRNQKEDSQALRDASLHEQGVDVVLETFHAANELMSTMDGPQLLRLKRRT